MFSDTLIVQGKHSYGLQGITLRQWGEGSKLYIGSFCSIASGLVVYLGGNHRHDWISTYPFGHISLDIFPHRYAPGAFGHPSTNGDVRIGNDVWIGENVTILSGISIGNGSVIACGSVVTKDVEDYTVVGGNPSTVIRRRFSQRISEMLSELEWWHLPDESIKRIIPLLQSEPDEIILQDLITTFRKK